MIVWPKSCVTMLLETCALSLLAHLATAVFFHEPSAIDLKVLRAEDNASSGFGFSLGYQNGKEGKLVIGAPRYDKDGRVYQCPVKNIESNKPCQRVEINFNNYGDLIKVNRTLNPDQYFYLGASIAATEDGFVTCAPLRTTDATEDIMYGAFGVCFAYDDASKTKPAKLWNIHSNYSVGDGGAGWSTLVDDKHDRIILSQFFTTRDTVTAKISKPDDYDMLINDASERNIIVDKMLIYGQAITIGNYFDKDISKTYYAFSMKTLDNKGAIDFFSTDNLSRLNRLEDDSMGSMFGASLSSADITGDRRAELFVGAPAQAADDTSSDLGAVHVYTASSKPGKAQMELNLTIWGSKDGARFGTTVSTVDVDGDSYPEIIVSAPFDGSGGALFIICGYEINTLMIDQSRTGEVSEVTTIYVTDLKRIQIIRKSRSFGLSLQPVSDYNENGSDELVVGSPEESTVTFYRGVRAITVAVTSEFKNEAAADEFQFVFASCVTIQLPPKPKSITTKLSVNNVISGQNATFKGIANPSFEINLQNHGMCKDVGNKMKQCCKEFTIISPNSCKVNTSVYLTKNIQEEKGFKNTWVALSAQSVLTKTTRPACICNGTTCSPDYTLEMLWSGIYGNNHTYIVGSSEYETLAVIVRNNGMMGCGACAAVRVSGALDYALPCDRSEQGYKCELPTPFRTNTNKTIDIRLLTNTLSNQDIKLTIDVRVYKDCDKLSDLAANSSLIISYDFKKVLENVNIDGSTMNLTISDNELHDKKEEMLPVAQKFTIFNNQPFNWRNVWVELNAISKPYVKDFRIWMKQSMESCVGSNETAHLHWKCSINLAQNSTTEITAYFTVTKKELTKFLQGDNTKIVASNLKLKLFPDAVKAKELVTMVNVERERTAGNNPLVTIIIAFLVALLLLLLIAFILYKLKFFKRKNKEELEELKREISQRSKRSATIKASCVPPEQVTQTTNHDDTVDLIVDETPLDNSLTPAQLNALAAQSEPGSGSDGNTSHDA